MGLNTKAPKNAGGGGNFEPMEPGPYPARLVGVVDLGLQAQRPYQGQEKKPAYEIALTYEFVDEFMKDEDGKPDEEKPRWLTEMLPFYGMASERSNSAKRFKAFDPEDKYDGDLKSMLGTPLTVVVTVTEPKKNGRVYENIDSVSPMRARDAEKCPELKNSPLYFDLDNPDIEVFNKLPNFLKKKITDNLEFAGSKLAKLIGTEPEKSEGEEAAGPAKSEDDENENPF